VGRTSDARERLIEAAGDLWHRRSYTDVGVGEICAAAGVQKGSFYHFFPSKQDLALAVIEDRWEGGDRRQISALMTCELPPLERLRVLLEHGLQEQYDLKAGTGACGCSYGNLAVEMSGVDPVLRDRLERLFTDWAGLIRIALDDAVAAGDIAPIDTAQAARAVLTYIEGLSVMVRAADDPDPVADLVPLAFRLVGAEPPQLTPPRTAGERSTT
jgi:TetR/AcrR family transcriptional regulator, transcriptional repressor for nem operon